MNNSIRKDKGFVFTVIGLITMILLSLTKIVPSSQIAGFGVFVGIAFFFIVEALTKTRDADSGLRFKTIAMDIRKPGVLLWTLLPIASVIATHIAGNLIFSGDFINHVIGRTDSMLAFNMIPLLAVQVVIAALGEEIAYRGFFVGKAMKIFPFWPCAVVSSIVFAAGHIAPGNVSIVIYDVATIFIDSIIYTIVYRKSGNCLISTISHILSNSIAIAVTFTFF